MRAGDHPLAFRILLSPQDYSMLIQPKSELIETPI